MNDYSIEDLVRFYLKTVYTLAYRYVQNQDDAEDITQETFVKVWRNLKRFDKKKSFRNWIFEITKNTSLDFLKKKKALPFSHFDRDDGRNSLVESVVDGSPLPNELADKSYFADLLAAAIKKLSPAYQELVRMHSYDNYTFQEIAELTGKPINTVKSQYRRALILLKKLLNPP